MSEVAFSLATRDDDAAIRALLASNPLPGRIRLRLEREPDYFTGCATMGNFSQVLVARDGSRVVGVACRAIRSVFINGEPADVGYLGQLRIDPGYRGRALVMRGFRRLRDLHADGRVSAYITTIVEGNEQAEGVLVRHRRGAMPRYRPLDQLITLALPVPRHLPAPVATSDGELAGVVAFLMREGRTRNFFPVWSATAAPSFDPHDFAVVHRDGEIAGVAGFWDQSAYKQTVVDGYAPGLAASRPLLNVAARMFGRMTLPRAGSPLPLAYGSFFLSARNDPGVTRELIDRLLRVAKGRGRDVLLVGLAESDPSLAAAQTFRHIAYRSGIYTVSWDDGDEFHDRLDGRPVYLDVATL